MSKIGLSLKIDVSKINKERLFRGTKGTYLDAKIFVDLDNKDEYGNNGMITQNWKDQEKGQGAILGNGSIFWSDAPMTNNKPPAQPQAQPQAPSGEPDFNFNDDVPF